MSAVLYLFLVHLGIGIAFTLLLVSREAGVKFFRFTAGLAAALVGAALAVRPSGGSGPLSVAFPASLPALAVALAALVLYWLLVGRALASLRPLLAWIATVAGAVAIVLQGLAAASVSSPALTAASMLTSAALLGGTCTAMVLGHWYLVLPSMQISHLQRIVRFHLLTLALRIVIVGTAIVLAGDDPLPTGQSIKAYVTSINGIFFWQRVLFGLAGPVVLGYMTWETAKIRSTQSATGILYVDFFTVVVGEVMASYVLLSTGLAV